MRETMRDKSVNRKPTRAASRQKQPVASSHTRQDSLSPARLQTPFPHDAALAAQAAQLRIHAPQPLATTGDIPRRPVSPTSNLFTTYTTMSASSSTATHKRSVNRHPENGIELKDISAVRSGSFANTASLMPQSQSRRNNASAQQKVAGKVKDRLTHALGAYTEVWKDRKGHVSDEQLAWRSLKNLVKQKRQEKRSRSTVPQDRGQYSVPYTTTSSNAAWPTGVPKPMQRGPTPPPPDLPSEHEQDTPITPPQPAFLKRERSPSVWTARTGMTTWSNIQQAVGADDSEPAPHSFAGASADKGKGKGKFRNKQDLNVLTADLPYSASRPKPTIITAHHHNTTSDFQALNNIPIAEPNHAAAQDQPKRAWDRKQHVFDPDRESYMSDPAARRYRAHTAASSIYSQPAKDEEQRFADFSTPPPLPSKYLQHAATTNEERPVSPLTADTSISAFFSSSPAPGRRNTNRRAAGDWTDTLCGGTQSEDGRVSPLSIAPKVRPAPRYGGGINEQYDQNPVRGTQFYDFYRDSGLIFSGDR